jgi:Pyruvate/2-oxoacid:ferredoxin oxidoreductase gamma subunit
MKGIGSMRVFENGYPDYVVVEDESKIKKYKIKLDEEQRSYIIVNKQRIYVMDLLNK